MKAISAIKSFTLITPIAEAFQDMFVIVRDAVLELFPALDSAKLSMYVSVLPIEGRI